MPNNTFTICGLVLIILVAVLFNLKKRIDNIETKIYSRLIFVTFVMLIFAIGNYWSIQYHDVYPFLNNLVSKLLLLFLFLWVATFSSYIFMVTLDKEKLEKITQQTKKIRIFMSCMVLVIAVCLYIMPLEYYKGHNVSYSYGIGANLIYVLSGIFVVLWIVTLIVKARNYDKKKMIPLYFLIVIGSIIIVIQKIHPEYLLLTFILSITTFIMYHTIENPDVKMIEQLNIAKDQADKANRAKTDFLSSMSHEIRTPLNAIVGFSECIKQSKTLDEAQDNADDIISASNTLLEIVNGILDISKIEAGKIEIHNSSYNSKELFDSIVKLGRGRLGEKPLEFRVNIAPDIPETLYGDHANVKKVIINILTNAIKYTDNVDIATQTIVAIICPITPYRVENKIYDARKDIKEEMRIGTSTL